MISKKEEELSGGSSFLYFRLLVCDLFHFADKLAE